MRGSDGLKLKVDNTQATRSPTGAMTSLVPTNEVPPRPETPHRTPYPEALRVEVLAARSGTSGTRSPSSQAGTASPSAQAEASDPGDAKAGRGTGSKSDAWPDPPAQVAYPAPPPAPPVAPRPTPSRPRGSREEGTEKLSVGSASSSLHPSDAESGGPAALEPAGANRQSLSVPSSLGMTRSAGTVKFDAPKPDPLRSGRGSRTGAISTIQAIPEDAQVTTRSARGVDMSEGFTVKVEYARAAPTQDLLTRLAESIGKHESQAAMALGLDIAPQYIRQSPAASFAEFSHKDEVMSLAFSPDCQTLVAGGEDATVVLWDMATRNRILEEPFDAPVLSVAFADGGEHFAAGNVDSLVALWSVEDKEQVGTNQLEGEILTLAFTMSPAYLLAAGTTAKTVIVMSVPDLQAISELRHEGHVRCVSFSSTGGFLAGCGAADDMHGLMSKKKEGRQMKTLIWQAVDDGEDCRFVGTMVFDDPVHSTAFAPSGKLLAIGGEGRSITLFLVEQDFQLVSELPVSAGVRCLSWTHCSRFLASGGEDLQVNIWDVLAERVVIQLPKASDWYSSVAFSRDTHWLAVCGYGSNNVTLYGMEVSSQEGPQSRTAEAGSTKRRASLKRPMDLELTKSKGTVKELGSCADATFERIESSPGGVSLKVEKIPHEMEVCHTLSLLHEKEAEVATILGQKLAQQRVERDTRCDAVQLDHLDDVLVVAFSPDGLRLVSAGEDGAVAVWDVNTRSRIMNHQLPNPVRAVAYSPGGKFVAAADMDARVTVLDTQLKDVVGREQVEGDPLTIALTSSPAEMLAVGTTANKVMLFSVPDMQRIAELRHDGQVHSVSFSADGGLLAGGGGLDDMHGLMTKQATDQEMKTLVWQVSVQRGGCKHLGTIMLDSVVHATAFSPVGKLLAVGCQNRMVAVLNVGGDEFEEVSKLRCVAGVRCLSWCSDPHFLASGGEDTQVSVWDIVSERIVFQLPRENDWICSLAFNADCSWLATCCYSRSSATLHPVRLREIHSGEGAEEEIELPLDQPAPAPVDGASGLHIALSVPSYQASKPSCLKAPVDLSPLMSKGTVKADSLSALESKVNNKKPPLARESSVVVDLGDNTAGFAIKISQVDPGNAQPPETVPEPPSARMAEDAASACGMRPSKSRTTTTLPHSDEVLGLAFCPDCNTLVAGGEDTVVSFWDIPSRSKRSEVKVGCAVSALACSPSGEYVAAGSATSFVTVWRARTSMQVGRTKLEGQLLSLAMVSSPEELLAVGTTKKCAVLLSVPDLEELALLRHDGCVRSVSFSPDGGLLAGGGGAEEAHNMAGMERKGEGEAKGGMKTVIWQTSPDGEQCKYLGAIHVKDSIHATSFSPSGRLLAVGGEDRLLTTLAVDDGFQLATNLPASASVRCLAWSSNSLFLASGGEDMEVSIWDIEGASLAFRLPKASDWPCAVAFAPDDHWLASCGFGSSGVTLHPIEGRSGSKSSSGPPPEIAGAEDGEARPALDPSASAPERVRVRRGSVEVPAGMGFEVCVASAGSEAAMQPEVSVELAVPEFASGHQIPVAPAITVAAPPAISVAPPAAPSIMVSSSLGGPGAPASSSGSAAPSGAGMLGAKMRGSLEQPRCMEPLKSVGTVKFEPANPAPAPLSIKVATSPDAAPSRPNSISAPSTQKEEASSEDPSAEQSPAEGFEIRVVKVGGRKSVDLVTRMAPRKSVASIVLGMDLRPLELKSCSKREAVRLEHQDEVVGLAMSSDGRMVLAGGEDRWVVLWDMEDRSRVFEARLHAAVAAVAYAPSGRYIAACAVDSFLTVWDTTSKEEVGTAAVDGEPLSLAMTSKLFNMVAVGTTDKRVVLISVPQMEEIAELQHDGYVHSLAFAPDGCTLAGGGGTDDMHGLMTTKSKGNEMKTVMWHVSMEEEECKYLGSILFEDIVHATAFSPTGKLLAVGGENRMIAMLVVDQNFHKASELICAAGVRCLAWSPNSRFLAEGGEDMQVSVWDVLAESIVLQLPKAKDWLCGLAFNHDNSWLATCGYGDNAVTLHPLEEKDPEAEEEEDSDSQEDSEEEEDDGDAPGVSISVIEA